MRCPPAFALAVLIGVALAVCSAAQQKEAIRIELEPDVRQEAADVRYFLTVWKQPAGVSRPPRQLEPVPKLLVAVWIDLRHWPLATMPHVC